MQDNSGSRALEKFQAWYESNCDDDWEHHYGLELTTLDNPGWAITVDLNDTDQEDHNFEETKVNYDDERDWIRVWKDGSKLKGACGPRQLDAMLLILADWLTLREPQYPSK